MRARGRHVFKLTWVLFCIKRVSMMVATNVQRSHETTSAYVKRRNNDTDHTHHHHTYMYNKISFARTIPLSLWMRQGPHAIDAPSLSRRCRDNNRAVRTERKWWGHDTSRWVLSHNRDSVRLPALCMCMAGWGECVGAFVWGLREHITSSHTAARLTVNTLA